MSNVEQSDKPISAAKQQERARRKVTPQVSPAHIFHLAEGENINSILEHGLMCTAKLLARHRLLDKERNDILRSHRSSHLRLEGMLIRDQVPMSPAALAPALDDGMEPGDWYALVNEHVFFWPDRKRLDRHLKACGSRPQYLMVFDAAGLFDGLGDHVYVSPINSGNARRKPARRGRNTFVPYRIWVEHGWPTGQRSRPPAEFLFRCDVPATKPYLIDIKRL